MSALNTPIDLVGHRFGQLTVTKPVEMTPSGRLWECLCDCGLTVNKLTTQLRRKSRRNGGCKRCEPISRAFAHLTHGGAFGGKTPLYKTWKGMRGRCENPNSNVWEYYGGKGVRVCQEWADFKTFRDWAQSHGYANGLSIDRIDSGGNYCPENCEWVTRGENSRRACADRKRRVA